MKTIIIGTMLVAVLVVIFLLGYATGTALTETEIEYFKGDKGDPGINGIDGKDGKDGKDGIDGKDGTNGTDGAKGETGKSGSDGKDAPVNENPVVTAELDGIYEHWCPHHYIFNISAYVDDTQHDSFHVYFHWRKEITDPWTFEIEHIGTDGYYFAETDFWYHSPQGNQTLYWLVETWDGSDIGLNYFEHTIIVEGD